MFYCASIALLLQLVKAIGIGSVGFCSDQNTSSAGKLPMILTHAARSTMEVSKDGDEVTVKFFDPSGTTSSGGSSTSTRPQRSSLQ